MKMVTKYMLLLTIAGMATAYPRPRVATAYPRPRHHPTTIPLSSLNGANPSKAVTENERAPTTIPLSSINGANPSKAVTQIENESSLTPIPLSSINGANPSKAVTQIENALTTIPLSSLNGASPSSAVAGIFTGLLHGGAFAVDGLDASYIRSLQSLRSVALACFEGPVLMQLKEAGVVFPHVESSGKVAPKCGDVDVDVDHFIGTFRQLEENIKPVLAQTIRILDNFGYKNEEGRTKQLARYLPSYIPDVTYLNNIINSGLFLMLTPSDKDLLVLKDFHGRPVLTNHLGPDSVVFLVGRGLVDWLLEAAPDNLDTPNITGTSIFFVKSSSYLS